MAKTNLKLCSIAKSAQAQKTSKSPSPLVLGFKSQRPACSSHSPSKTRWTWKSSKKRILWTSCVCWSSLITNQEMTALKTRTMKTLTKILKAAEFPRTLRHQKPSLKYLCRRSLITPTPTQVKARNHSITTRTSKRRPTSQLNSLTKTMKMSLSG